MSNHDSIPTDEPAGDLLPQQERQRGRIRTAIGFSAAGVALIAAGALVPIASAEKSPRRVAVATTTTKPEIQASPPTRLGELAKAPDLDRSFTTVRRTVSETVAGVMDRFQGNRQVTDNDGTVLDLTVRDDNGSPDIKLEEHRTDGSVLVANLNVNKGNDPDSDFLLITSDTANGRTTLQQLSIGSENHADSTLDVYPTINPNFNPSSHHDDLQIGYNPAQGGLVVTSSSPAFGQDHQAAVEGMAQAFEAVGNMLTKIDNLTQNA